MNIRGCMIVKGITYPFIASEKEQEKLFFSDARILYDTNPRVGGNNIIYDFAKDIATYLEFHFDPDVPGNELPMGNRPLHK